MAEAAQWLGIVIAVIGFGMFVWSSLALRNAERVLREERMWAERERDQKWNEQNVAQRGWRDRFEA